jgi:mucin-19
MSLPISIGSGATVGTEIIGGAHYGFNKIVGGQSGATIGWKVNTDGSGLVAIGGNVTLSDPKGYIGLVTVGNSVAVTGSFYQATQPVSIGNLTLDPGSQTQVIGNVTLANSKNFIGLVTVGNTVSTTQVGNVTIDSIANPITFKGNVTIDSIANAVALKGNLTLSDSKQFIGLVSVSGFANPLPVTSSGNVTIDSGNISVKGNVTLSDSKGFIGLVTVGNTVSTTFAGNVTLDAGSKTQIIGNITLSDPKGFIGLVTIVGSLSAAAGNITLDAGSKTGIVGNVTLADPKGFIGLVTVGGNTAWADPKGYIGLVTITGSLAAAAGNITLDSGSRTGIVGNVTLTDSKGFIGLVTVGNIVSTTFSGNVTLDAGSFTGLKGTVTIQDGGNSITTDIIGNVTISDSKGFIGLVTVVQASTARTFAGNVTLDAGSKTQLVGTVTIQDGGGSISTDIIGNVTISDSKGFIGLVTLGGGTAWADPKGYIGLVTITGSLAAAAGNITLDAGSKTQIVGNVTLNPTTNWLGFATVDVLNAWPDPNGFIGLTTAVNGQAWPDPHTYIGLVTITGSLAAAAGNITLDAGSKTGIVGNVTLSPSINWLGFATVDIQDAWADPKTWIGLVTVSGIGGLTLVDSKLPIGSVSVLGGKISIIGNVTLSDPKTFIGLVTIGNTVTVAAHGLTGTVTIQDGGNSISTDIIGNVTISDSKNFIGLVTAWSRNAGTAKTLYNFPIAMSAGSIATIAVPTGGNALFYITQNLINSDATVRVSIKSGVTYLTGNASIGITLNPGGGWVEDGGVDAPNYIGLASGAAIVIEKFDMTATSAKIGGKIMYFQE